MRAKESLFHSCSVLRKNVVICKLHCKAITPHKRSIFLLCKALLFFCKGNINFCNCKLYIAKSFVFSFFYITNLTESLFGEVFLFINAGGIIMAVLKMKELLGNTQIILAFHSTFRNSDFVEVTCVRENKFKQVLFALRSILSRLNK